MQVVAAGLCDHVDHASQYAAKLRAIGMRNDLEFLDGIDDGRYRVSALERSEVIQTVHEKEIATVGLPVDGRKCERRTHRNGCPESARTPSHAVLRNADGRHARSQRQQLRKISAVQRKIIT